MTRFRSAAMAVTALLLLGACAGGEPPRAELAAADAAIQAAQRSGAGERAPAELNTARMKYQSATAAVHDEDYERAARLAREAEIDAQLATAKAQAAQSRAAAEQVRRGAATLQRETTRPAPSGAPVRAMPDQSRPINLRPQTVPAK
jgi:hypothetical protein